LLYFERFHIYGRNVTMSQSWFCRYNTL